MDPLSVVAAIFGILGAAGQVSSTVRALVSKSKKAPKELQMIGDEADAIHAVLGQLQALLLSSTQEYRSRGCLILVEQVVVTLSACVTTFSEVDALVGTLVSEESIGLVDRVRWTVKSSAIEMVTRTFNTPAEANSLYQPPLSTKEDQSICTINGIQWKAKKLLFEEELNSSWVYRRAARRDDDAFSIVSSAGRTVSWSVLSGLSLSDISNIAMLDLPIYLQDIGNRHMYEFREVSAEALRIEQFIACSQLPGLDGALSRVSNVSTSWPTKVEHQIRKRPQQKDGSEACPDPIFGVSLQISMKLSSVLIFIPSNGMKSGRTMCLPTVVANCGAYLREDGRKSILIGKNLGVFRR